MDEIKHGKNKHSNKFVGKAVTNKWSQLDFVHSDSCSHHRFWTFEARSNFCNYIWKHCQNISNKSQNRFAPFQRCHATKIYDAAKSHHQAIRPTDINICCAVIPNTQAWARYVWPLQQQTEQSPSIPAYCQCKKVWDHQQGVPNETNAKKNSNVHLKNTISHGQDHLYYSSTSSCFYLMPAPFRGTSKHRKSVKRRTGSDLTTAVSWTKTYGMKQLAPKLTEAIKPPKVKRWVTLCLCVRRQETETRLGETIIGLARFRQHPVCFSHQLSDSILSASHISCDLYFCSMHLHGCAWSCWWSQDSILLFLRKLLHTGLKINTISIFDIALFDRLCLSFHISAGWHWVPLCTMYSSARDADFIRFLLTFCHVLYAIENLLLCWDCQLQFLWNSVDYAAIFRASVIAVCILVMI